MTFWDIYFPASAALVSTFVVKELYQIAIGFYLHKKQEKLRKEFEAKVESGEIDPMDFLTGIQGMGDMGEGGVPMSGMPQLPTASGGTNEGHGQYL
jgi:hypothetical protein